MTKDVRNDSNTPCEDLCDQQSDVVKLLIKCQDGDYGNMILRKGEDLDIAAERFGIEHNMDLLTINQLSDQIKQRCRMIDEFNSNEVNLGKDTSSVWNDSIGAKTGSYEAVKRVIRTRGVMTLDSIHNGYSSSDNERNDPKDLSLDQNTDRDSHSGIRHGNDDNSLKQSSNNINNIDDNCNIKCDSNRDDKCCDSENNHDSNDSKHSESCINNWNDRENFVNCERDNIHYSEYDKLSDKVRDQNYINMRSNSKHDNNYAVTKTGNVKGDEDEDEDNDEGKKQERSFNAVKSNIENWSGEGLKSLHTTSFLSADANVAQTLMLATEGNVMTERCSDSNGNEYENKNENNNENKNINENNNQNGFEYEEYDNRKIQNDDISTYISDDDDDTHYDKNDNERDEIDYLRYIKMSENHTIGKTKMLFIKKENLLSTTQSPRKIQENVFARMHAQGKKNADRKEYLRTKFEDERKSLLESKTFRCMSRKKISFIL